MSDIDYNLVDVIIERPYDFSVGRKHFSLYPVTLAKMFLLKRQVDGLGVDTNILKVNPYLEAMRVVRASRDICCHILAIHTAPNTKKDLFDQRAITIRKNYFIENLSDDDLATLIIVVLTSDKTEEYIKHLELDKERSNISRLMDIKRKHDTNNFAYGGKTILGTFIQQLKEMGYSDDEIRFEMSYSYLKLMLADKVVNIYLSDSEIKDLPADLGGTLLDGNDPNSIGQLNAFLASKGLKPVQ
ncbi:MAG: hypothetical protein IKO85_04975 [Bacteroidaceae bacterium]|nr:hypothetical protein [Bacteroidaceae bacterium]